MEEDDLTLDQEPEESRKGLDDEDPDLLWTQDIRKMLIAKLFAENKGEVPTDKETADILAKFLDGIDKQIVNKQRIQIAKKDSSNNAQIALLLEEMSRKRNSGEKITIDVTPSKVALPRAQALSSDWLPAPVVVSGELNTSTEQETPEQFFKRVEADNPELLTGGAREEDDD